MQYAVGRVHAFARTLARRRLPVVLLRGTTAAGREASILCAGKTLFYLPERFFCGTPERELLGEVPVFRLEGVLRRLESEADLTVISTDRYSSRLFFRDTCMSIPLWVGGVLEVPADTAALVRGSHSVAEDMRVVRREGLITEVSSSPADFDTFYAGYYVPFTERRHGEMASVSKRYWLERLFRTGGILWVLRNRERIAGVQFGKSGRELHLWAIGTAGGAPEPVKAGAFAALYYHSVELARKAGCVRVDFGGSRPSLTDGLLRFKRKWGVALRDNPRNHYELLMRVNRWNRNVTALLSTTPLIYREGGGFAGLAAIDSDQPATQADTDRLRHFLWSDGLRCLSILSASGWEAGIKAPPRVSLLDCAPAGRPARLAGSRPAQPRREFGANWL